MAGTRVELAPNLYLETGTKTMLVGEFSCNFAMGPPLTADAAAAEAELSKLIEEHPNLYKRLFGCDLSDFKEEPAPGAEAPGMKPRWQSADERRETIAHVLGDRDPAKFREAVGLPAASSS